jgi:FtsP/CotA-like multicopper oxidase with cupredoxin domain
MFADFGNRHDQAHAGRLGNVMTVNGAPSATLPVLANDRVRLRLLNASSARVLKLRIERCDPKLIAIDGQPVDPTTNYGEALTLGPANRIDLMVDVIGHAGDALPITEISGDRLELGKFVIGGPQGRRAQPLVSPIAPVKNPLTEPDLARAKDVPLVITGGAMNTADMSLSAGSGPVWALNDVAGMQDMPLFSVPRGTTVRIRMENRTAWPHAMHVHGHHFRLISREGRESAIPEGPAAKTFWWDTLLIGPAEAATIAFIASNPGKWMLHCHMLDHQASGMDTWFEVTG